MIKKFCRNLKTSMLDRRLKIKEKNKIIDIIIQMSPKVHLKKEIKILKLKIMTIMHLSLLKIRLMSQRRQFYRGQY